MKLLKQATLYFCILLLLSCSSSNHWMNSEEIKYVKNSSVFIIPDKKAIEQNRKDGIYKVVLNPLGYNLCLEDTSKIKKDAQIVAEYVKKMMSFKEHYQYIDIQKSASYTLNTQDKTAASDAITCSYDIRVPIGNESALIIYKSSNNLNANHLQFIEDEKKRVIIRSK